MPVPGSGRVLFLPVVAVIGILVSQFLAGRSDKKGDRKNLIVFCCVLGMLACVLFAWNRNYFILVVCRGIPQQLWFDRQPANVCPRSRACRPYGTGSRHVQFNITCAGFAGLGDWPAAGLRAGHGVQLYGHVPQCGSGIYCLRHNGLVVLTLNE